ncbi:unnamed protein product [Brachionus calyciflorus]|uniref:Phospholipase A2 n=1 Tax=Brachionus calyciflorus TaxID=104777 RepID=A0A813VMC7_9BILA|nr:unnamed protein product [Brachionus calyciflorus]
MNLNYFLILSVLSLFSQTLASPFEMGRNLIQFKRMVEYMTGRNALDFDSYGNYCGMGGSGTPVDAIDNCCKNHDECYENASSLTCYSYFSTYDYTAADYKITCLDSNTKCQSKICACDKAAAECFRNNLNSYNPCLNRPGILGIFQPSGCK